MSSVHIKRLECIFARIPGNWKKLLTCRDNKEENKEEKTQNSDIRIQLRRQRDVNKEW